MADHLDNKEVIIVFDFFAGIGGLSRSLAMADIPVAVLVVVEKDVNCRRLHRRRWPGCHLIADIQKLSRKEIETLMRKTPGITGVIAGGGSPCQGLSKLSSLRRHLEDPRSALFFDLSERLKWIQEIAVAMGIWSVRFCENVIGDDEDVDRMSKELEMDPVMICASDVSRVRRPRLYTGRLPGQMTMDHSAGSSMEALKGFAWKEPLSRWTRFVTKAGFGQKVCWMKEQSCRPSHVLFPGRSHRQVRRDCPLVMS